jgi:hypothetical protein
LPNGEVLVVLAYWQLDRHSGPFARSAVRNDGSSISFDQSLRDGESKAEASRGSGPGRVSAVKSFEDVR